MTKKSTAAAADENLLTQTKMTELRLAPQLLKNLQELGISKATPIQQQTLPKAIEGRNIAGQARTGTGKTLAFLLATFQRLLIQQPNTNSDAPKQVARPRALIVAPTRELADQIAKDARPLAEQTNLKVVVCYGGTGYNQQREAISEGVDLLIGTPGRLIDYYKQKIFTLKCIEVVVLDEADRMFDLGFISDIRYLFRKMPQPSQRQSFLFSATLSHRVMELAYEHMGNPELIKTATDTVNTDAIEQQLYHVGYDDKLALLIGLLRRHNPFRSLVFINTKREADKVSRTLNANGIKAAILSGDVAQNKRMRLLNDFKQGELPVMVATDVAARGLHIPEVSHVFNYDLPQDPQDYVHRIGRTARAGHTGTAISLACETYVLGLPDIEDYIGYKISSAVPGTNDYATDLAKPKPKKRKSRGRGNNKGRSGSRHAKHHSHKHSS